MSKGIDNQLPKSACSTDTDCNTQCDRGTCRVTDRLSVTVQRDEITAVTVVLTVTPGTKTRAAFILKNSDQSNCRMC